MEFECWHTFFGKLMSILGVIFILCLCYLIWGALHIRRYRRRMLLYRDFVRETYIQQNQTVPILITRYYVREVEAYNRVIKLWPFINGCHQSMQPDCWSAPRQMENLSQKNPGGQRVLNYSL